MPKLMKIAFLTLGFSLTSPLLMENALQAGEGSMMTPRPAAAMWMQERTAEAPLLWLRRHLRLAGMNTKRECDGASDCEKGEVCCEVSGLETYCAAPDECYGKPIKDGK